MYDHNERLTSETRELFGYSKSYTSKNAIAVFVGEEIEYDIGEARTPAGGLSFPPVIYHHADDYPLRKSVLVRLTMRDPSGLPLASGHVVAHELGHMLLDTGDHVGDTFDDLMLNGARLSYRRAPRSTATATLTSAIVHHGFRMVEGTGWRS